MEIAMKQDNEDQNEKLHEKKQIESSLVKALDENSALVKDKSDLINHNRYLQKQIDDLTDKLHYSELQNQSLSSTISLQNLTISSNSKSNSKPISKPAISVSKSFKKESELEF